jgi:hypothetical protein
MANGKSLQSENFFLIPLGSRVNIFTNFFLQVQQSGIVPSIYKFGSMNNNSGIGGKVCQW